MGFIFKPVRWVLGQIIIFIDWLTRPKQIERAPEMQREIDKQTENMALYQFKILIMLGIKLLQSSLRQLPEN